MRSYRRQIIWNTHHFFSNLRESFRILKIRFNPPTPFSKGEEESQVLQLMKSSSKLLCFKHPIVVKSYGISLIKILKKLSVRIFEKSTLLNSPLEKVITQQKTPHKMFDNSYIRTYHVAHSPLSKGDTGGLKAIFHSFLESLAIFTASILQILGIRINDSNKTIDLWFRKIRVYVSGLIILTFLLTSCQEVYENEDLEANEKIPVVYARLSNSIEPQFVQLSYARPYNQDLMENISGATVKVIAGNGQEYFYEEQQSGYYQTERGYLVGKIGETYTLHIELPGGKILQSYPQTMPDTIGIQSAQATLTTQEETFTDINGDIQTRNSRGYAYRITVRESDKPEAYYRLNSDFYTYSVYSETNQETINYPDESGDSTITALKYITSDYDCYEYFTDQNQLPIIGKLTENVNLNAEQRSRQTQFLLSDFSEYTDNEFIEWIVLADVYSISEQTYNYYNDLNEQLTAPNRIYDPIPTQLTGNMYCASDTLEKVLGYFEVSSRTRRYHSLYKYVSFGNVSILSRIYPDTTNYTSGCHVSGVAIDTVIQEINPIE